MPCNSEYMDPTGKERELQRTAKLLVYVKLALGEPIDRLLKKAANDDYCNSDYVSNLCAKIKGLSTSEREAIVFNAKNRTSRDLADWWEDHVAADTARIFKLQARIHDLEINIAEDTLKLEAAKLELQAELND